MTPDEVDAWTWGMGYLIAFEMADGRLTFVVETVVGQGQLGVGDEYSVRERYSYPTAAHAIAALLTWRVALQFVGEPRGWHRHQPSDRRRPDGEPALEYVAP